MTAYGSASGGDPRFRYFRPYCRILPYPSPALSSRIRNTFRPSISRGECPDWKSFGCSLQAAIPVTLWSDVCSREEYWSVFGPCSHAHAMLIYACLQQTYAVPGAPVWAMSAAPTQDCLAVATSSPHIHFLSISPYSMYLEPASPITRTEAIQGRTRTLSIAWGPPTRVHLQSGGPAETDGKMWVWRNHHLVTGNSDSSLRKWNVLNGRMIGRMAVNKLRRDQGKNRGNIVWGVAVLA